MNSGARQRAEAALVLDAVIGAGRSLDAALAGVSAEFDAENRAMIHMLCYGCLRHHWQLRAQLGQLLDRPLKKRDRIIESLLTVGLFQLNDTRVPDHAAVSATVEATRLLKRPKLAGFVNAVLRNHIRQAIANKEPTTIEARFNHPQWLIDRIRADWPNHWEQILASNNERAPMWLRVNARFGTAADYLELNDIEGALTAGLPQAIKLISPMAVNDLPGFSKGQVSVQDGAAQIAATWLLDKGGGRVLDACAAPGGKTGHLLELLGADAEVTAIDADVTRIAVLEENLDRLNLSATVIAADASNPEEWWDGRRYDLILLDAPCSATGVIRRHPDIKLLRRASDIEKMAATQRQLLESLWPLLAPGGHLLYVTCSVLAAENDRVVDAFLSNQSDAEEDRVLHAYNIHDLMLETSHGFQVLPGMGHMDGFYFACLLKTTR